MALAIGIAVLFLLFPALVIWLCTKSKLLRNIGIVMICYIAGIIVGNLHILPASFTPFQTNIQDLSVALALPLLLLSLDVKNWMKASKSGLLCMLLATIAIVVTTFVLQITLVSGNPDGWKLAGMSSAVYTGGTPNLAAMKTALQVDNDTYILFNTYDTVFSLIYIVFMATIARVFFQKVFRLKPHAFASQKQEIGESDISDESIESYGKLLKEKRFGGLLCALGCSAVICGISVLISGFFSKGSSTAVTILAITTLGIAASFIKPLHRIKYSFQLGMYIIYVFCFTVASTTNLDMLIHINWTILLYVVISIYGSMLLHALMSKLCKIDSDTMIITSVSAICSPPFVPVVVSGLKNKQVLISGLITGIIGYAIGNYLGIGVAMLYRSIFG